MKNYFKRTRHHLHALVGLIGGCVAHLCLSLVLVDYRDLSSLDKAICFMLPAVLISCTWELFQNRISKSDIAVSTLFICLGIYFSDIIYS